MVRRGRTRNVREILVAQGELSGIGKVCWNVNLNELFERMSKDELECYARDGKLPDWFTETVSIPVATAQDNGEEG